MKVLRGPRNGDVVASGARSWALSLVLLLLAILPGLSTATTADSLEGQTERRDSTLGEAVSVVEDGRQHGLDNDKGYGNLRGTLTAIPFSIQFNRKDYLNGLVSMSVNTRDDQLSNLALMRTHKTGSTTLATLLYRYGRRHGLEVAQFVGAHSTITIAEAARKTQASQKVVDIMHYHIGDAGPLMGTWDEAKDLYKQILRDPENINFFTIFREPREHLMSYYSYFLEPKTHVPIEEFLSQEEPDPALLQRIENPLCQEFGVHTWEDLERFTSYSLPEFELVLLTEKFDESLMIMRHILRWHMIDMTYVYLNRTEGFKKNNNVLKSRIPFDNLPSHVQEKIDDLTRMDKKLYDAGEAQFEKRKAPIVKEVDADMVVFEQLQIMVNDYLNNHRNLEVNKMYRIQAFYEHPPPMHNF